MAGTWGKSRHRSKNMWSFLSVGIASYQLRQGPSSLASTRQLMSMSSHVFGKAVAGSVEAGFAELFGFADCDFGERELGSVAGSPCGYNNPTLNRWRVILRSRG